MHYGTSLVNVTFEWNQPEGDGPEYIIDSYHITILPQPVTHQNIPIVVYSFTSLDVGLEYNTLYNATIVSVNCVGQSPNVTLSDIHYGNFRRDYTAC